MSQQTFVLVEATFSFFPCQKQTSTSYSKLSLYLPAFNNCWSQAVWSRLSLHTLLNFWMSPLSFHTKTQASKVSNRTFLCIMNSDILKHFYVDIQEERKKKNCKKNQIVDGHVSGYLSLLLASSLLFHCLSIKTFIVENRLFVLTSTVANMKFSFCYSQTMISIIKFIVQSWKSFQPSEAAGVMERQLLKNQHLETFATCFVFQKKNLRWFYEEATRFWFIWKYFKIDDFKQIWQAKIELQKTLHKSFVLIKTKTKIEKN